MVAPRAQVSMAPTFLDYAHWFVPAAAARNAVARRVLRNPPERAPP